MSDKTSARRRWLLVAKVAMALLCGSAMGFTLHRVWTYFMGSLHFGMFSSLDVHAVAAVGSAQGILAERGPLRRPIGCPQEEALMCRHVHSELHCSRSPCCAWTVGTKDSPAHCVDIDFSRQLWLAFSEHHSGYSSQYMVALKHLALAEEVMANVGDEWELVIVLPRVMRSVAGIRHPSMLPLRKEDFMLGGTLPGPWRHLFSPEAAAEYITQLWRDLEGKGRRPYQVIVIGTTPMSVSTPPPYVGAVKGRGDWSYASPTRKQWRYMGQQWVPNAPFHRCEGGGYKSLTGLRSRPGLRRQEALPAYDTVQAVGRRIAAQLPGRSMAGDGIMVHSLHHCGPSYHDDWLTRPRIMALQPAAHIQELADGIVKKVRRLSYERGGGGLFGAMHIRLEADWMVQCSMGKECLGNQSLAEVGRCLEHFHKVPKVLYVAAGIDLVRTEFYQQWRWRMALALGISVVSKGDINHFFDGKHMGDGRFAPYSREELAALETAIVNEAVWVMGWDDASAFSWLIAHRARRLTGRESKGVMLGSNCPGMDDLRFRMFLPSPASAPADDDALQGAESSAVVDPAPIHFV